MRLLKKEVLSQTKAFFKLPNLTLRTWLGKRPKLQCLSHYMMLANMVVVVGGGRGVFVCFESERRSFLGQRKAPLVISAMYVGAQGP